MRASRAVSSLAGRVLLRVSCLLLTSLPALADDASDTPAEDEATTLDELLPIVIDEAVVVTGEKTGRSALETGTSVDIVTGDEIEERGLPDLRAAIESLPNTNSSPSNNGNNGITIRGINSEGLAPSGNPRSLVSLHVDGAAQSAAGIRRGLRGLWDVEQVEVLRGPQSTFHGRSSLAGAVVVKTRDPTFDWEHGARFRLGSLGEVAAAAAVSGPIVPSVLAFRLSAESMSDEHDILSGDFTDVAPAEREQDPSLDYLDQTRYENLRGKLLYRPRGLPGFSLLYTGSYAFDRPAVLAVTPDDDAVGTSDPADYSDRIYDISLLGVETRLNRVSSHVIEARQVYESGSELVATTSHVRTAVAFITPSPLFQRDEQRADRDLTQEIRFLVKRPKTEWMLGGFHGRIRNDRKSLVRIGVAQTLIQDVESMVDLDNFGVFASLSRDLSERWNLFAAARFDREEAETRFTNFATDETELTSTSYGAFLPRFTITRRFGSDVTLGGMVSRGYRAGFQERGRDIAPEYLMAYELFVRAILADRWLVSGNVFHYDWSDQQVAIQDPVEPRLLRTENAAASTAHGVELRVRGPLQRWLVLNASYGYTKTELEDFVVAAGDFSGNEFPEAPRHSAYLGLTAQAPRGWFGAIEARHQDRFYATADLANQRSLVTPSRTLVDLRAGRKLESWTATLFVKNALDAEYLLGRDLFTGAYIGDPLTVGFQLEWRRE